MALLGPGIGFALNLPAVCGAIVAIGITADSFIVYFERIRDEIREGRTLASGRRARLAAGPAHHPGLRLRVVPRRRGAVHRHRRQGPGLRLHAGSDHPARRGRGVPLHQAGHDAAGPHEVLRERSPVVRTGPEAARRQAAAAPLPPSSPPPPTTRRRREMSRLGNLGARLYRGEVGYDFVGKRKIWYGVSILITITAIVGLAVQRPQHGHRVQGRRGLHHPEDERLRLPGPGGRGRGLRPRRDRPGARQRRPARSRSASWTPAQADEVKEQLAEELERRRRRRSTPTWSAPAGASRSPTRPGRASGSSWSSW